MEIRTKIFLQHQIPTGVSPNPIILCIEMEVSALAVTSRLRFHVLRPNLQVKPLDQFNEVETLN